MKKIKETWFFYCNIHGKYEMIRYFGSYSSFKQLCLIYGLDAIIKDIYDYFNMSVNIWS